MSPNIFLMDQLLLHQSNACVRRTLWLCNTYEPCHVQFIRWNKLRKILFNILFVSLFSDFACNRSRCRRVHLWGNERWGRHTTSYYVSRSRWCIEQFVGEKSLREQRSRTENERVVIHIRSRPMQIVCSGWSLETCAIASFINDYISIFLQRRRHLFVLTSSLTIWRFRCLKELNETWRSDPMFIKKLPKRISYDIRCHTINFCMPHHNK